MYSKEVQKALDRAKIRVGDTVEIKKFSKTHRGILLPRIGLGDTSSIVIKMENGYNMGVRYETGTKISLVKHGKAVRHKHSDEDFEEDPSKPYVSILGCGGTIASRVEYTTGAVFPEFSPSDLIVSFPEIGEIANMKGRKVFDIFSEDMTTDHWKTIAREVVKELKEKTDGIILTHGTDTMHYTGAALSFMLRDLPVPVVIVGAQRSSDRGSSDNMINLVSATLAAKSDVAEVSACMHGESSDEYCNLFQGTKFRKMHSSRRDAFRSVNVMPFAKVWYKKREVEYLRSDFHKRGGHSVKLDDKLNPNAGLVHIHPGIKPEFVESLSKHYDGLVIAGTGLGHVPTNPSNDKHAKSLIPSIKEIIESGVPVVMAPQTIFGRINMNVYSAGRLLKEIGVIGDGADWLPETALVKLMFVLGHAKNMKRIEEMMMTNIAGEISERTEEEAFTV